MKFSISGQLANDPSRAANRFRFRMAPATDGNPAPPYPNTGQRRRAWRQGSCVV